MLYKAVGQPMLSFVWASVDAETRERSIYFWEMWVSYQEMRVVPELVQSTSTTSSLVYYTGNTLYCATTILPCRQQRRDPAIIAGQTAQDQRRNFTGQT